MLYLLHVVNLHFVWPVYYIDFNVISDKFVYTYIIASVSANGVNTPSEEVLMVFFNMHCACLALSTSKWHNFWLLVRNDHRVYIYTRFLSQFCQYLVFIIFAVRILIEQIKYFSFNKLFVISSICLFLNTATRAKSNIFRKVLICQNIAKMDFLGHLSNALCTHKPTGR